jgi:hypothetical protein
VVNAMRGGDLVAARACAEALRTLVTALSEESGNGTEHSVEDLGEARRRR